MNQDFAKPTTTRKPGKKKKTTKKNSNKKTPTPTSKKNKLTTTPNKSRAKSITTLLLLLGAFGYGLYFLQSIPPTKTNPPEDKALTKPAKNKAEEKKENRFNFYDILPETEVTPPIVEEYQYREKSAETNVQYVVQTGSFRSIEDAERQKATIAFQGLKAKIKTAINKNGTTWHRVLTGPYSNRSTMNSALDKLVAINIEPLVKKVKKEK